ncbi:uncharacterized protein ACO6RY_06439 [Pungitius sinensis]
MEGPTFSFAPEQHWTVEKEKELIEFFSKHSCLWNHKSESYKNRQLRWETLERLRCLLSARHPPAPFTVEDLKNKFKNLRTTFQRQYKMVKARQVFSPQWKHYEQMMFLQDCWDVDGGPEEKLPSPQEEKSLSPREEKPPPSPREEKPPPSPREESPTVGPAAVLSDPSIPDVSTCSSPSCVASNAPLKCLWTEERERALIAFYSEHNCLWKKNSENHNNRLLRLRLLEAVISQLSDDSVPFSVEDVKCKFKNLRTIFNREYKAVQASRGGDKLHVSKWKHYQQLLFLCESCDEDEGPDDLPVTPPRGDRDLALRNQTPPSAPSGSAQIKFRDPADIKANSGAPLNAPASSTPQDTQPCTGPSPLRSSGSVQADSKRRADPRCHWSEAKIQQLIWFYSEHSCLWNHRSESYKNKLLRQSQLEKLSSILSDDGSPPFSTEDIKTKFRNLRTIFQREHKAVSSNKTCGSEDFHLPKWKHYYQLMFLCERPEDPDAAHILETPPSPTPPDSQHSSPSSSPPRQSSPADSSVSGGRKRAPSDEGLGAARTLCQSQAPHAGFLKYVEECLNETPADKVKKLKKMIIETIHSASEEA